VAFRSPDMSPASSAPPTLPIRARRASSTFSRSPTRAPRQRSPSLRHDSRCRPR
jgi:hypothetical protein